MTNIMSQYRRSGVHKEQKFNSKAREAYFSSQYRRSGVHKEHFLFQ